LRNEQVNAWNYWLGCVLTDERRLATMQNRIVLIFTLALILSSCSSNKTHQTNSVESFELIVLRESWGDLQIGYEGEAAQSILRSANVSDPLFVVSANQIEKYDWDLQTITLTQNATTEFTEALLELEADADEIERLKNLKQDLGWGNPVELALYIQAFVVQVNEQFTYGGIFLDPPSQMAIDFPVARVTISDAKVVIAFLPTHIPFLMIDPVDGSGNFREAVVADEAASDVGQLDFFTEWTNGLAMSATSVKFRAIIRDEKIRLFFETEGK
jgi:hypothetical protein